MTLDPLHLLWQLILLIVAIVWLVMPFILLPRLKRMIKLLEAVLAELTLQSHLASKADRREGGAE